MIDKFSGYFKKESLPYPLALYRIGFGILVMFSLARFALNGWIESLYLEPDFHFSYYGFSWVKPLGIYTYLIFLICFSSALFVTIGYKYRFAIITLFLSFTYIELMDKTTYLNHYYLISCISFLMIFLPCASFFAVDSKKNIKVPKWTIDSLKFLIVIVYIYAGLAKINSDWLLHAQPLKIWLRAKYTIPIIGETLLQKDFSYYLFSWGGMIYDCIIPFLLLYKRTRYFAFFMVLVFHIMTRILFPPIGMFPYIMIFSCIIFFDNGVHKKILDFIRSILKLKVKNDNKFDSHSSRIIKHRFILPILSLFFILQIIFPLRSIFYPGELLWTEQGYRFSWRVMLIEKAGYTTFKVVDNSSNKFQLVDNMEFLTPFQEKQMSFQPDMILEYAHYLGATFEKRGFKDVSVYADSYVTLNGRPSKRFIDPKVDLLKQKNDLKHKTWILPLKDDIKSLL
ncbi:MAG: HTTM domain-containing protein [Flavobacteriaceae bacterium]|nr:HTTM domain-containing protein [Flavobacteriaceae bacterium]